MSLTAQERFEAGLRGSHYTKQTYMSEVQRYMDDCHLETLEDLSSGTSTQLQDRLVEYLGRLDKQGLKWATRNKILSAITDFYIANGISLDWKYLQRSLGPMGAKHVNVAYTSQQIAAIIKAGKPRLRAVVALLATAGPRSGALALDDPNLFYGGELSSSLKLHKAQSLDCSAPLCMTAEKIDRIYVCLQCKTAFIFRSDIEEHLNSSGHPEVKDLPIG